MPSSLELTLNDKELALLKELNRMCFELIMKEDDIVLSGMP